MTIPWWGMIPFVIMLGAIAVLPLVKSTEHWWERNTSKLLVALVLGIPVAGWLIAGGEGQSVIHALVEYSQFIILLLALFVVSGGIFLAGDIRATPRNNSIFMAVGAVLASFVGTTGAAMLLIRPLLNTNVERRHKVHTVVFTIFIVANCGGLLTPLGDPPLFLGMLRGVPFAWTFGLFPSWLLVNGLLIATYWAMDRRAYAKEPVKAIISDEQYQTKLGLRGSICLLFFAVIILAVAFAPSIDLHAIEEGHASVMDWIPVREIIMLAAAAASLRFGDRKARYVDNQFTWGPIAEVAALFIGIFLTMVPALHYLRQVAPNLPLNEITFHLFSGGLSSVLDNAPTYVTFFEMAQNTPLATSGEATLVAGVPELYLLAISLGAVFWGAMTYIGNGPNFMVKSVADSRGVATPSFGGYVVWSVTYLLPALIANMLIIIAQPAWAKIAGAVLAVAILARALVIGARHREPLPDHPSMPGRSVRDE